MTNQPSDDQSTPNYPRHSSRGRTPDGKPNPIDVYVGRRIYQRRMLLGYSQDKLADMLGLTFQQVQKYEHGYNRLGASRLWDIAQVLQTDTNYYFEGMDEETAKASPRVYSGGKNFDPEGSAGEHKIPFPEGDPCNDPEIVELIADFIRIEDPQITKALRKVIAALRRVPSSYYYNKATPNW